MMRQQVHVPGPMANNSVTELLPISRPMDTRAAKSDTTLSELRYMRPFFGPQSWAARLDHLRLPSSVYDRVPAPATAVSYSRQTDTCAKCKEHIFEELLTEEAKSPAYALDVLSQTKTERSESNKLDNDGFEVKLCIGGKKTSLVDMRLNFNDSALSAIQVNGKHVWPTNREKSA